MATPFTRITIDGTTLEGDAILAWAEAKAQKAEWAVPLRDTLRELCSSDGSMVVHTSGTTGPPRHFRVSPHDLIASARLTEQAFGLKADDTALACLPFTFIAGKMMLVRAFVTGLHLRIIAPSGDPLSELGGKERFDFTAMVPLQLHAAVQHDRKAVERRFARILLGGAPVTDALVKEFHDLRTPVQLSYGSTETLTHVAVRDLNGPHPAAHFTALDGITFTQDARERLVIRTPHLSVKEHVTNDLVELIDATRFRWLGRMDHVILSGGLKIHPEQLEARLADAVPYPFYFTALPNDRLGQAVMLVVETHRTVPEITEELTPVMTERLLPHEMPKRIHTVKSIPRTSSGKIQRGR